MNEVKWDFNWPLLIHLNQNKKKEEDKKFEYIRTTQGLIIIEKERKKAYLMVDKSGWCSIILEEWWGK